MKKILLFDFDGVIHSYKSGWKGARNIPDPPVDGAIEFLLEVSLSDEYEVYIYSSRSRQFGGKRAMKKWLKWEFVKFIINKHPEFDMTDPFNPESSIAENMVFKNLKNIKFPTKKPPAFITIDDRAICFDGDFSTLNDKIKNFKTWYNRKEI